MRTHGLQGAKRRGKPWRTTTPDPFALRRPDLVQRDFSADGPNRLWVGDFTYLRCWQGVVFFAFILDAYSAGSSAGSSHRTCAPSSSWTPCAWRSTSAGPAPTSNSLRTPIAEVSTPARPTPTPSPMPASSPRSDPSATPTTTRMAESFVDSFKTELITDRVWRTRSQLELAIVEYVAWFNTTRLHESLGDIPPAEFETGHAPRSLAEYTTMQELS